PHRRRREPRRQRGRGLPGQPQSRRPLGAARDSQAVTALNPTADEDRFSFTPFTRHPFFTYVNRWILERVICPGRQVIVDLGCGPGAVTALILERVSSQEPPPHVIGVDPSPSALAKARTAISSKFAEFVQGSAEWLSKLVKSADQDSAALVDAGYRPTTVELLRVDMTRQALIDIGRFSLFIEGALPGAPLEEGAKALEVGLERTMEELKVESVPRHWLEVVAE